MAWTEDDLVYIVDRLLAEGVPPGVVARVFTLDDALVKERQKLVRVARYGTADLEEYEEQLRWDSLDWARRVLAEGKPADQARVMSMMLGKGMTGKRVPDSVKSGREALDRQLEAMKSGGATPEKARSQFVVLGGGDASA